MQKSGNKIWWICCFALFLWCGLYLWSDSIELTYETRVHKKATPSLAGPVPKSEKADSTKPKITYLTKLTVSDQRINRIREQYPERLISVSPGVVKVDAWTCVRGDDGMWHCEKVILK